MKQYRIVKRRCWWTCLFDTSAPQFLYYDYKLERFEVGSIGTCCRNGKCVFDEEEIKQIKKDYNLDDEFIIEEIKIHQKEEKKNEK